MSFDVSALMGQQELKVWLEYNTDVKVQVRHISRETFADLVGKATTVQFDRRHQKSEELDNLKFGELLGVEAIVDWSGLVVGDQPFPCTADNIKKLMRSWVDFARFIADVCTDLERLVTAEKEAARKNSQSTSALGLTTPE